MKLAELWQATTHASFAPVKAGKLKGFMVFVVRLAQRLEVKGTSGRGHVEAAK